MVRQKKPLFAGPFSIYSGCSSAAQSGFCSQCSTWNIVFAELRACGMFHVEHFGVCSPLPWGGFCLGRAFSSGGEGGLGEAFESKLPFPFSGRRWGKGSFLRGGAGLGQLCVGRRGVRAIWARGGRVSARRSTRRFGHAALTPCSLFAPRRTTRRQCRVWLGWHRAEGRAKSARAPPCLAGLLIQARETPPGGSGARSSPRSAHQNGHFSLS